MSKLAMWTVYDHPTDFPHCYVARRFEISAEGAKATNSAMVGTDLGKLRDALAEMGLTPLNRNPEDDPKIVETWL